MNRITIEAENNKTNWQIRSEVFELNNLSTCLVVGGAELAFSIKSSSATDDTAVICFENEFANLKLEFGLSNNQILIAPLLKAKEDKFIDGIIIFQSPKPLTEKSLFIGSNLRDCRVLINSDNSWGKTGSCPLVPNMRQKSKGDIRSVQGGLVTAIWSTTTDNCAVIGSGGVCDYPLKYSWADNENPSQPCFSLHKEIYLKLKSGDCYELGSIVIKTSNDITAALEEYGNDFFGYKPPKEKVIGWSSWDYYLANPTFDDIKENIKTIDDDKFLKEKINLISVDMGWSNTEGDWRTNIDFPQTREEVAKYIKEKGFKPGIWTMPLLVSQFSSIACRKPQWLIKDSNNFPIDVNKGQYSDVKYSLDPTIPEVGDYIFGLYSQMRKEGFEYFKLDFLKQSCRFPDIPLHNNTITRTRMLRGCIELIRKAVGNALICACGAPLEAVQGLVDYVRIGDDVKNHWSNIQRSARSIIHRYWMHGRLWNNDGDFLIVRGFDTADISQDRFVAPHSNSHQPFHWLSGSPLTLNEARVWAGICIVSGSYIILGDRLNMLNEKGVELIKKTIEKQNQAFFRPLDIKVSAMPSVWHRYDSGENIYGIFNFFDTPKTISLDKYGIEGKFENIWEQAIIDCPKEITVAARDAVLLQKI